MYFAQKIPQPHSGGTNERYPVFKQLERLMNLTHKLFGFLFFPEFPDETIPISDYRIVISLPSSG